MIYYTETKYWNSDNLMNSLSKGRDDYFEVLRRMGLECISIPIFRPRRFLTVYERLNFDRRVYKAWWHKLKKLGSGDTLVIHSPSSEKFSGYAGLIREASSRGCRVVTIVFELETFFNMDYRRLGKLKRAASVKIEKALFDISDAIVVHNDVMKEKLESIGVDGAKMFSVGVMDYLRDEQLSDELTERISMNKAVAFAGNLSYEKSRFEYDLPDGFRCNLYGADYTGHTSKDICYKGVFDPMSLMDIMEGSFGLVWDGDSVDGCTGSYGDYLRFNNPHKIALYLASGMPVIVWSEAAMAHFVRRENCGLTVDSLREVPGLIASLTADEYESMRMNACRIGNEMRKGVHIRTTVEAALEYTEKKNKRCVLIIFTREPREGYSKTRMMPYLNAGQCAELQRCMLRDLEEISRKIHNKGTQIVIAHAGGCGFLKEAFNDIAYRYIEQRGESLGDKMRNAISDVIDMGYERAVLIGSDIPDLDEDDIKEAFELLNENDIVLGSTEDGGYYLIGMDEIHQAAFPNVHYGTDSVYEETVKHIKEAGLSVGQTGKCRDMDTAEDIADYRSSMRRDGDLRKKHTGKFLSDIAKISVIIPVYNEISEIDRMMDQMNRYVDECEIIFVDGMSTDGTAEKIAKYINNIQRDGHGFKLITCEKGRGVQMNRGAEASTGDVLFFLHCDSTVPDDFPKEIRRVMASYEWGCFGVKFASGNFFMLTNRIISNQRAKLWALPFGDQGIFIDRDLFFDMGMYPEQALMEDYEFSLALKEKGCRPGMTRRRILTSDRRYGKGTKNILRTELNMCRLRHMHRRGAGEEVLKSMYEDIRS